MPNAKCQMPNAKCQMPNAKCQMPNAKCQMPNAKCHVVAPPHLTHLLGIVTFVGCAVPTKASRAAAGRLLVSGLSVPWVTTARRPVLVLDPSEKLKLLVFKDGAGYTHVPTVAYCATGTPRSNSRSSFKGAVVVDEFKLLKLRFQSTAFCSNAILVADSISTVPTVPVPASASSRSRSTTTVARRPAS